MSTNVEILYANRLNEPSNPAPTVLVFGQYPEGQQPIAWQVINQIGNNSWHKLIYTADTEIQILWDNGRSGTFPLVATWGEVYTFKPVGEGFALEKSGECTNGFDVINETDIPKVSVRVLQDGKPIISIDVNKGEKTEFVLQPKLYFGISSVESNAIVSFDSIGSIKEISLEGLKSLTVNLRGSAADGYTFEVSDEVPLK